MKYERRKYTLSRIGNSLPVSLCIYVLIVFLICRAALTGSEAMGYNWQWYRVPQFLYRHTEDGFQLGELVWGLWGTIKLSVLAFALATILGLGIVLLRLSKLVVGSAVATVYLEIVRNTPILILLYLFYYILGQIFNFDRFTAAVLCLAAYHAALISEVFRAGIKSVPQGQWEAARSIGMSDSLAFRKIILPQTIKIVLPPLTGEAINLVKSSAIVSVIAVSELTTVGRNLISDTYMSFEIWFTIAIIYAILTLLLSILANLIEKRLEN
ncbi:amino acid ABC transporter permease [Mesorhizobium sp. M1142]|uniref:amino acid ABC transporter permease n=1 Tax=Mesorhizobium sp. M1142 TaxID=2957060 RepID=UPI00333B93CD